MCLRDRQWCGTRPAPILHSARCSFLPRKQLFLPFSPSTPLQQDGGDQRGQGRRGALQAPAPNAHTRGRGSGGRHPTQRGSRAARPPELPTLLRSPSAGPHRRPAPPQDGAWPQPRQATRATRLCQHLRLPPLWLCHALWQGVPAG